MRRVAEEAIGAHDEDDQPPIIPRYDPAHSSDNNTPIPRTQVVRQIYTAGPGGSQQIVRAIPATAKNVIYLKSTDGGTQKMMVRAAGGKPTTSDQQIYRQNEYSPGTVLASGGARVVAVRPSQGTTVRQVYNPGGNNGGSTRFVRVQNATIANSRPGEQQGIVRRVVQQRPMFQDTYQDQDQNISNGQQQPRYIIQGAQSSTQQSQSQQQKIPRAMIPRGGLTMQMVQQQQHPDHRRMIAGRQRQKVTTYRDFMASRGYLDTPKFMSQTKPTFLPFEFNEEEEREINEAIAREEEWMRLEEENKTSGYDSSGNAVRSYTSPNDANRAPPYVSNLLPSSNDTPDDKVIKQVLDVMFSQVCRWDRQYGWSKTHMKRARQKNETEKTQLRKHRQSQREVIIAEHMDRLKKEINKRRTKIENEAEQQCGLLTPWRKSRSRPHRTAKAKTEVKKEVINPADITLGGDTYDYGKDRKPLDSIASGVARRRRTSANLSKSEDDNDHHPHHHPHSSSSTTSSTRGTKERRTSEPPRVTFYTPGAGVIDIDMAITHCICQQLFDASRMYIQCDMCARWYHGDCVNVNEKMAMKFDNWTCEQCIDEQERCKEQPALYCVCQKPYDDTKFYVGCDSCQGWFHPECVGTTREQAEQAAEYNCPNCIRDGYESEGSEASVSSRASVQLTRADYTHVVELLELLLEHRMSTPFRHPVDLNEFPDYNHLIKKPMDLSTISKKVENTGYLYLGEFVNDVNLMFENAKTYNPKDNAVFKCAETMQEVFDKKLIEVREQMTARQQLLLLQQQQHLDPMSSARKRVQSESQKTTDSLDIDSDQLLPLDASLMKYFF